MVRQLCGRLVVRLSGRRVEDSLPGAKGRLLFAYLVLNRRRRLDRDELLSAVYGDDAAPDHQPRLSVLLSKVRRVVGPEHLAARSDIELVLSPDAFVDVEAALAGLHRAESHVARGEWAEAWGPAGIAYHVANRLLLQGEDRPWLDVWRRRLDDVRLRGLECFAAARLGLGGPTLPQAEDCGRRLIELAPFRETGHRILMEALERRGNGAEALLVYDRLRVVAALLERLHQDPVAALAVRRQLDQPAPAILGLRQRRSAEAEPRRGKALESAQANVVEAMPPLVQPQAVVTLEQRTAGHVIGDAGRAPCLRPLAVGDVGLRPVQSLDRCLDVDERVARQHELDLGSSGQELGAHDVAELREQDAQPRLVVRGRLVAIDRHQQLVAVHPAEPVEHEVCEEQPPVGTGQPVVDSSTAQPHYKPAAELDSRSAGLRHVQQG